MGPYRSVRPAMDMKCFELATRSGECPISDPPMIRASHNHTNSVPRARATAPVSAPLRSCTMGETEGHVRVYKEAPGFRPGARARKIEGEGDASACIRRRQALALVPVRRDTFAG